ncbi:hypothetical protein P3X46_014419 [Hevea brasiliensis]|uniref:RING-type E3 ubiquitin transferase n=1 Tax=Hevea brasiliensis TaxID=3981 RepID=A0ABQ9M6M9_HEVBR|nr:RING-H2 finger protein ATL66 [Hevea brasiliensis]KAJ9175919.1 hypothetical protein P3X46_014419 [Hevea brasiliensis]
MSSQDSQPFHWYSSTDLNNNDFEIHGRTLFFIVILFAVIVLIAILFWVCRCQHHHFPSHPSPHAPPYQPQGQGLHPTKIKSLLITLYQSSSSSSGGSNDGNSTVFVEGECCICLGIFEDGDKVKVLPQCHHCFHSECVDKWLIDRSSCPLCRASLLQGDSESPVLSILA